MAGSSIVVPAGALASPTTMTMTPLDRATVPGGGISGGSAYVVTPASLRFTSPVTVTLWFNASALPSGIHEGDLAVYAAPSGTTDQALWLSTRPIDGSHISALAVELSQFWVAGPLPADLTVPPPAVSCSLGGAVCVDVTTAGSCPLCQCNDGSECPGSDPTQCCACPSGVACPYNASALCGSCNTSAESPLVLAAPMQSLANCGLDSDVCLVCPSTDPVVCTSGACCPQDHGACCADGKTCGTMADACAGPAAGPGDAGNLPDSTNVPDAANVSDATNLPNADAAD